MSPQPFLRRYLTQLFLFFYFLFLICSLFYQYFLFFILLLPLTLPIAPLVSSSPPIPLYSSLTFYCFLPSPAPPLPNLIPPVIQSCRFPLSTVPQTPPPLSTSFLLHSLSQSTASLFYLLFLAIPVFIYPFLPSCSCSALPFLLLFPFLLPLLLQLRVLPIYLLLVILLPFLCIFLPVASYSILHTIFLIFSLFHPLSFLLHSHTKI